MTSLFPKFYLGFCYLTLSILNAVTSSGILKVPVLAGAGWYNGLGFLLGTAHGQF
jgi:hypothetical protein